MKRRIVIEVERPSRRIRRNGSSCDSANGERSFESARKIRKEFYGKEFRKITPQDFEWPRFVTYLGRTNAENYYSNKMLSGGKWEMYKHIAEAPQYLFVNEQITNLLNDANKIVEIEDGGRKMRPIEVDAKGLPSRFYGRRYEIRLPLPGYLADLASCKGIQWLDASGRYFEARIPHTTLAAARHASGSVVLVVYSAEGMHFLITGDKLDVSKDGIIY